MTFIHPDLNLRTHTFFRNDSIRPSLPHPYESPYQVMERSEKFLKVRINNKENTIAFNSLNSVGRTSTSKYST